MGGFQNPQKTKCLPENYESCKITIPVVEMAVHLSN